MNDESQAITGLKDKGDLDRRQFLNGLGKWSLAIIAAVTALRDGTHEVHSRIGSRFDASWDGRGVPLRQIAKKKGPHGDQPHIDNPHYDSPGQDHRDYYRREAPKGGTTGTGGGVIKE